MNQFFDIKRFTLLVLKHGADNKRRYILALLAYFGLLILWFLFGMLISEKYFIPKEVQYITFYFSLFAVGTFYASQYYNDLSSRAKGSHFLLVPASSFEKFLCSLLYTVVLFALFLTAAFYVADVIMVNVANAFRGVDQEIRKSEVVNVFTLEMIRFNPHVAIYLFPVFLSVHSLFLLGSVYFRKYNFIKTIIACFLIFLVVFLVVYFIHELLPDRPDEYYFSKIEKWFPTFLQVLAYSIAPLNWVATYFVLKAKQV